MTANLRRTTASAVILAIGLGLGAPAPAPEASPAPSGGPVPLAPESVQVPVEPDDGGHRVGEAPGHQEFVPYGTTWPDDDLTYGFVNHTGDLSVSAQESAIASALATWSSVSPLTFTKVADCGLAFDHPNCAAPDIRILFGTGAHGGGDGDRGFDGPGGVAAHAFYPPPNGQSAAGDLHLDDGERWSTTGNGVDLQSVALHELGHVLGLAHATAGQCPSSPGANRPIMCGTIIGVDRTLAPDDVNGIQSLYGLPAVSCAGRAVTVDLNEGERPTGGADVILGTPGPDKINAGGGRDTVCGGGGGDTIDLGPGHDRAIGGLGNDLVYGRTGNDRLEGGDGGDRLFAGDGADVAYGARGGDNLDGGPGPDKLYAGPQSDLCHGRAGRDVATGCERELGV